MSRNRKNIRTTRGKIFQYWKDYCIDNCGKLHLEGDYPIDKSIPVVIDWEEQHCWACGKRVVSHNEKYPEWVRTAAYSAIWNDIETDGELQRAHIVADSLGGSTSAKNLFLLCPECHQYSPDTNNSQMFFEWVYNRRKSRPTQKYYFEQASKILKECYGLSYPFFDTWSEIVKVGKNVATHVSSVAESSYVYLLVANGLKNKSRLEGEAEKMFEDTIRGKISEIVRMNPNDERIGIYREILGWYREAKEFESTQELKIN